MANAFQGVGIVFGFPGGPTGTLTGLAAAITNIQSLDFSRKADKEEVRDGTGNVAGLAYYNHSDDATIDFIFSSGTATGSGTVTDVPSAGGLVTLTDTNFPQLTKTLVCEDFTVSRGNTKALSAKVVLKRYITNSLPS